MVDVADGANEKRPYAILKMDAIHLTTAQEFEIERMNRAIDAASDPVVLRNIAKKLLRAWMVQKSATLWAMKQTLPRG